MVGLAVVVMVGAGMTARAMVVDVFGNVRVGDVLKDHDAELRSIPGVEYLGAHSGSGDPAHIVVYVAKVTPEVRAAAALDGYRVNVGGYRPATSPAYTRASRSRPPARAVLRVPELTAQTIALSGMRNGDLSQRATVCGDNGRPAATSAATSGRHARSCFENMPASASGRPSIGDVPPKPTPPCHGQPIARAKSSMVRSSAWRWRGSGNPE